MVEKIKILKVLYIVHAVYYFVVIFELGLRFFQVRNQSKEDPRKWMLWRSTLETELHRDQNLNTVQHVY